jgi:hypothetical protein
LTRRSYGKYVGQRKYNGPVLHGSFCSWVFSREVKEVEGSPKRSLKSNLGRLASRSFNVATAFLLVVVGGFCATPSLAAVSVTYVQSNYAVPQSTQSTVQVAFRSRQTAGDLNVIVVGWNDTNASVNSVTDSSGNVYTRAVGPTTAGGVLSQSIYCAKNIAAASSNTVTIVFSTGATSIDVRVLEYAGADPNTPVDVTAAGTGNGGTSNSGTATTTNASDLIFGANIVTGMTSGPGSNFTTRILTSPDGDIAEDRSVTSTGRYSATAPASGEWIMQMVAFKVSGATGTSPTITSASSASFTAGTAGSFTVTATGSPTPSFSESGALPSGVAFHDNGNATATLSGTASTSGTFPITITAGNGVGTAATQNFTLAVNPATQAPAITSASNTAFTAATAGSFTVTATGSPTPSFSESGALPSGVTFHDNGNATATLSGTASTSGTFPITITASNGVGTAATQNFTLAVNQSPSVTSASGTSFTAGVAGSFTVTTSGSPTPALNETGSLPTGVTFVDNGNGTATLSGTATSTGSFPITITANNGIGTAASQNFTLTISGAAAIAFVQVNSATPSGSQSSLKVAYTKAQTAGDLNVVIVGWNDSSASVSSVTDTKGNTYLLAVGPTVQTNLATQSIYYASNIAAASANGNAVTVAFNKGAASPDIRIAEYTGILAANPVDITASAQGTSGSSNSGSATTTNANDLLLGGNLVQQSTTAAGSGYTTRVITSPDSDILEDRIVTSAGSYSATASLSGGAWIMQMVAFRAAAGGALGTSPTISSANNTTFAVGTAASFTLTATGSPTPALSETGSLPSGVTFHDNGNGSGTLGGTPASGGTFPITFVANNGVGTAASQSFTLMVNQAPAITSANSTTFNAGSAGSFTLTTTGSPAPALSESGALPSGVTFHDNGNGTATLSGTTSAAGSYLVTVTANNGVGSPATQGFTLIVGGAAPTITTANNVTFTVAATSSFTIAATGNPTPTISESGALPSGITFQSNSNGTGTLSGTTTAAGTYSLTFTASNGVGTSATQNFTLTVSNQDTQPPTTPTNLAATAISGSQIDLSWTASTDNVGVTGYLVERCAGVGCTNFARTLTVTGTTYSDTGLVPNTSYTYQVKATDAAGNFSPYSNTATATTLSNIGGLVAAYSFDEGSGTTVNDLSGNGNTGTVANTTWTTSGEYGSALVFNGKSSTVTIPDSPSLHLTSAMTLEAWVKPSKISAGWADVIYKGSDNYFLEATSSNASDAAGGGTFGSDDTQTFATSALSTNTWAQLALTYDGATLRLYVNGVQVSTLAVSGNLVTSSNALQIGGDSFFGQYFSGTIDEVRVYNIPLNVTQIQTDMSTPVSSLGSLPGTSFSPTSLSFGSVATGSSSSAQNITLTNTGGAQMAISSVAVSGADTADFSQTNTCGSSLGAGSSCNISVTFAPQATGSRFASVQVTDNAPNSPQTINLSGTGTGFSVSPQAIALTFSQTEQFNASSGSVTWSVDGNVGGSSASGTISASGLYTPPAAVGSHVVTAATGSQSASAAVYVTNYAATTTFHNDNSRTGQNSNETVLTLSNVNQAQFGKLFSDTLDGLAYASPLYVAGVNVPNQGVHNVVYIATENDSVYAYDADNPSTTPLWKTSFLTGSNVTTVPCGDTGECGDIPTQIGITGTPVIDPSSNTLYVVANTKEGSSTWVQRLHALDITTGGEKFGGPVVIQATVHGDGNGSQANTLSFDPLRENQRAALLLSNGVVYIAWAAHGDQQPWHGWLMGYNAATLQQTMVNCVSPNGYGGGIWMSNGGLATDASGDVFFTTGNGDFNANSGGGDYGDSIVKVNPSGAVDDYFTPYDQASMESGDIDLASAGPVLLLDQPGSIPHLLIAAGKSGSIYVVNRDNMGQYNPNNNSQIVQTLQSILPNGNQEEGNYSAPVFFNGFVYFAAVSDNIKTFQLSSGTLSSSPSSQSSEIYPNRGGSFAISSNAGSNGILWATQDNSPSNGVLFAYDASNLSHELYNSSQAASRDTLGVATKFSIPLVANGKVFMISNGALVVYGLLP